jgi:hypothetical protein
MQSKISSLIEQLLNVSSGFIVSAIAWHYLVGPILDIETSSSRTMLITATFTVISIVRGYCWRRLFNYYQ